DLVCVLQDRTFDNRNQFAYLSGGMMDQMHGLLAAQALVNGQTRFELSLATRAYRIRLLNGSNSRVYKLTWDDGTPMRIIATDGALLEQPVEQQFLTLAPSQRADVILDLSRHAVGSSVQLRSAPYSSSEISIDTGGMMGAQAASVPNGASMLLMNVKVARREQVDFRLPARLAVLGAEWNAVTDAPTRKIALSFRAGSWTLGGRTFEMNNADEDETVRAGSTQIWEVTNAGGMMGQQMAHPFHVHGTQFRVLSRQTAAAEPTPRNSIREGLVDAGWRDTVLVLPRETLRLQVRFTSYTGLFLYHCHILEHEDMGMMRNFRVTA
ncbi:MAG: multicopper oxidase domain-containing protein, partial [Gemmatimonadaceae bacterium]